MAENKWIFLGLEVTLRIGVYFTPFVTGDGAPSCRIIHKLQGAKDLPGILNNQFEKWMEMVLSNHFPSKDWGSHPVEKTIASWLLRVTGG